MAMLPIREDLVANAVYEMYERRLRAAPRRPHLGASLIGEPCERKIWYTFRWCSPPGHSGRMQRLFDTGEREEPRIAEELAAIGCEVYTRDPATGRQFYWSDHGGHFSGSQDGAVQGVPGAPTVWHLLECKTHNVKSFSELKSIGVQKAKPMHLAQMTVYMGWSGLTRALYYAVCKDNDEIYTERVPENPTLFQELRAKALRIIGSEETPARTKSYCDHCDHLEVCSEGLPPGHCRTCLHACPVTNGVGARWLCRRDSHEIPRLLQERGCEHHLFLPSLVPWGREVERGDGYVIYEHVHQQGTYFANSTPPAFPAFSGESFRSSDLGDAR